MNFKNVRRNKMANGVNKVILVGHVGRDPEQRYTPSGTAVTKFSLATTETWGSGDARKNMTEWHNIVVWGKTAEFCANYVKKGTLLYIEGKIRTNKWKDREGNNRTTTEIVANSVTLLSSKRDEFSSGGYEDSARDKFIDEQMGGDSFYNDSTSSNFSDPVYDGNEPGIEEDDIPF